MSRIRNPAVRLPLSPLVKFALGSAWGMLGRLAMLCAVSAVALAFFSGVYSAMGTIGQTRDGWYDEGRLPDLELRFDSAPPDRLATLTDTTGVDSVVTRTITNGHADADGQKDLAVSVVATPAATGDQAVGQLVLLRGTRPTADDEAGALIGDELARYHSVEVGDRLSIRTQGSTREVTVRGVVRDSEHLISPLNPSLFVSAKGSLGMVYVPPGNAPVNSAIVRLDGHDDLDAVRDRVLAEAAESGAGRPYAVGRTEQFDYQYVNKNLTVFRTILPVPVAIGGLAAVFVSLFLSARWIGQARQQIAVLLALGHERRAVAGSFLVPYALLALTTMALGHLLGLFAGQRFLDTFTGTVGLPAIGLVMDPRLVLIGFAAVLLTFAAGAVLALHRIFRMSPKEAMAQVRPDRLRHGRSPGRLGRLGAGIAWPPLRIAAGNLLRTPLVSLVAILSTAVGFSLTAAFFLAYSNVMSTSRDSVARNEWDVMVDFNRPVSDDEAAALLSEHGAQQWTPFVKTVVQADGGEDPRTLFVGGFDPSNHWHKAEILAGQDIGGDTGNGVVLESGVAHDLGLDPGDDFTIRAAGKTFQVRLTGTMSSALPGEARVSTDLGRRLSGLGEQLTGAMVRLTDTGPSAKELTDGLDDEGPVQQALTKDEIAGLVVQSNDQVTALLWMGALVSIAVAVLLVGACLGYTILSRQDEYRLLGVIGFKDRVVRGIVVLEAATLGVLAILLAVPPALAAAALLDRRISDSWFHVDVLVRPGPLLQTFIPGLVLLPLLAVPMAWFVLPRQNLTDRARRIG